jgi:hypothetical protein
MLVVVSLEACKTLIAYLLMKLHLNLLAFGTSSLISSTGIFRCFDTIIFFRYSFLAENKVEYDEMLSAF